MNPKTEYQRRRRERWRPAACASGWWSGAGRGPGVATATAAPNGRTRHGFGGVARRKATTALPDYVAQPLRAANLALLAARPRPGCCCSVRSKAMATAGNLRLLLPGERAREAMSHRRGRRGRGSSARSRLPGFSACFRQAVKQGYLIAHVFGANQEDLQSPQAAAGRTAGRDPPPRHGSPACRSRGQPLPWLLDQMGEDLESYRESDE